MENSICFQRVHYTLHPFVCNLKLQTLRPFVKRRVRQFVFAIRNRRRRVEVTPIHHKWIRTSGSYF